jgi:hypothetical protein
MRPILRACVERSWSLGQEICGEFPKWAKECHPKIWGDDRNRFSLRGFRKLKQTAVNEAIEKKSEVLKEEALIWSLLYVNLSHLFEEAGT